MISSKYDTSAGLILAQRRRRLTNINPAMDHRLVFTGIPTQQAQDVKPILF